MKRIQLINNWYKLIQQSHRNAHICLLQPTISTEQFFTNLELKTPEGQWRSLQRGIFLVSLAVKFPTYDVFPCNMHESHYKLHSVCQIQICVRS